MQTCVDRQQAAPLQHPQKLVHIVDIQRLHDFILPKSQQGQVLVREASVEGGYT